MDEEYDIIILGTGLKEAFLSALLQKEQLKVLNIDRNDYYGGDCASLLLDALYKKFRGADAKPPAALGDPRYWSVDLCPKFLMAGGDFVNMLRITRVTPYMDLSLIPGSYIANSNSIYKVPATKGEALSSSLLGLIERFRFGNMLKWINDFEEKDAGKHASVLKQTAREFFASYDLSKDAVEFCGHALALHTNDDYLSQPCLETILKIKLYASSLARFGTSPFIYPQYGLGTMSEGFSRQCAVHGGLQMLEKKVTGIEFGADGKVSGVKLVEGDGEVTIKAKRVLADPTYIRELFPERIQQKGAILHSIVFMKHPVPETSNATAIQLVIPAAQAKRKHDIYCAAMNDSFQVCGTGWYLAVISTTQENPNVDPEQELQLAYRLLGGNFAEKFTWVTPYLEPAASDADDNLFVTESQDPTTHFEIATQQVLEMYKRIVGKEFDFNQPVPESENM